MAAMDCGFFVLRRAILTISASSAAPREARLFLRLCANSVFVAKPRCAAHTLREVEVQSIS
jgi:hypothetical protein